MNVNTLIKATLLFLAFGLFLAEPADAQRNRRGSEAPKKEELFPNATRTEPKIKASPRVQKDLQKLLQAYDEEKFDDVINLGEALVAHKNAGNYERSMAYQLIGIAKVEKDDYPGAIAAYQKAIESDGLDNNGHYQMLLQVGNLQYQDDQFEQASSTLNRFLQETGKEDPQVLSLQGGVLYQLERYDEAAGFLKRAIAASEKPSDNLSQMLLAIYINQEKFDEATALGESLLAAKPDDARLIFNLATMYAQADQLDRATSTLEGARTRGLLDERGYRQLYALYLNMENKEAQAIAVIEDGLAKEVLKPNAEIYTALGQAYYFSDKPAESIEAYRKSLPFAQSGENALNLARILSNEEKFAESKKYAQEALAKGLSRPGDAWIVIGRAEHGMNNRAGLIAAYREAAKFPETKQTAEEWLKKNASR
ncbi:tetratricopeptide repeat protein [Xanthomonadaceae bacterium JHOS43]|nr:tetratricopeptide repeat protein [Xanthomonadaceae bacterium JHOS43]MCX7562011.1 tetratricopeptide repeat protein [Xanthomonadaceae bacterium XH05]